MSIAWVKFETADCEPSEAALFAPVLIVQPVPFVQPPGSASKLYPEAKSKPALTICVVKVWFGAVPVREVALRPL